MGKTPTGRGDDTGESSEDTSEEITDTTIDEYDSEESTPVAPPTEEGSDAAGAAAGTEGASGGAAGGAGGGATAGGAPATGTTGGSDEESTEAPGGEVTEPEKPEEDESEEEANDTPPRTSEPEEPPEYEPAEPEHEDTEQEESDDENDDEEDEEPEVEDADVLIHTDPWDTTGWGNEPDIRELEETYGPMVSVSYEVLPPRRLEDWDTSISMPLTNDPELPNDTTTSYRALSASKQQGLFRPYLRRLRIAALSEGQNVEDETTLLELADEIGLNSDQLQKDMEDVETDEVEYFEDVPQMDVTIGDVPHNWTENVEFGRMHARMLGRASSPYRLTGHLPSSFPTTSRSPLRRLTKHSIFRGQASLQTGGSCR